MIQMKSPALRVAANARLIPIDTWDNSLVLYLPLWYPYWDMSGSPTIYSYDQRNRLACTVIGATWGTTGRYFDGADDAIDCGANSIMNFTSGDFSIGVWVNFELIAGQNRVLFIRGELQVDGYRLFSYDSAGSGVLRFETNQAAAMQLTASTATLALSTWYYLVVTRSGTSALLYKDGVAMTLGSTGTHTNPLTNNRSAIVGAYFDKINQEFKGTMGEVQVYNRALSAGEVMQNYQNTKWRYHS